ncbi:TPA: hypothetical protein HA265_00580 [Candidatus Woesearchaeota archaeon]|nr:hypothetical protein [Candidatus Woesearchaeota archaeon]
MRLTPTERRIIELYRDQPNIGLHGMRKDWYEGNGGGVKSPCGTVYFSVIGRLERELGPEEFIHRLRRSVPDCMDYALKDMTEGAKLFMRRPELDKMPVLLYLVTDMRNGFIVKPEKLGERSGGFFHGTTSGLGLSEGTWAFVPASGIVGKIGFTEDDLDEIMESPGRMELTPNITRQLTAGKIFYRKAAEEMVKVYEQDKDANSWWASTRLPM